MIIVQKTITVSTRDADVWKTMSDETMDTIADAVSEINFDDLVRQKLEEEGIDLSLLTIPPASD